MNRVVYALLGTVLVMLLAVGCESDGGGRGGGGAQLMDLTGVWQTTDNSGGIGTLTITESEFPQTDKGNPNRATDVEGTYTGPKRVHNPDTVDGTPSVIRNVVNANVEGDHYRTAAPFLWHDTYSDQLLFWTKEWMTNPAPGWGLGFQSVIYAVDSDHLISVGPADPADYWEIVDAVRIR